MFEQEHWMSIKFHNETSAFYQPLFYGFVITIIYLQIIKMAICFCCKVPQPHSVMTRTLHIQIKKMQTKSWCCYFCWTINTLRPNKMPDILQTTNMSDIFSWMKIVSKFHWSLFLKVQWTIWQSWFRLRLDANQKPSHYLNQWWQSLLTHISVTRPRRINLLRPSDAYMRQ